MFAHLMHNEVSLIAILKALSHLLNMVPSISSTHVKVGLNLHGKFNMVEWLVKLNLNFVEPVLSLLFILDKPLEYNFSLLLEHVLKVL